MTTEMESHFRNRRREILRAVRRSSPALVWSGGIGLVVVAPNKSPIHDRIWKIMDRWAVVTRGDQIAGKLLHKYATAAAYNASRLMSRGGVDDGEPSGAISAALAGHYHSSGPTLAAEACVARLNETPEHDYIAHIRADGSSKFHGKICYFGTPSTGDSVSPHRTDSDLAIERIQTRLLARWRDWDTVSELIFDIQNDPDVRDMLSGGVRRDVVLLDREAFLAKDYERIFTRIVGF